LHQHLCVAPSFANALCNIDCCRDVKGVESLERLLDEPAYARALPTA
jgi:hypothetical protein